MFNESEEQEIAYLKEVVDKLYDAYQDVNQNISKTAKELQDQKTYLYENKTGMDAAEKASVKQTVNMQAISGEAAVAYKKRLLKLISSPYFGRIDFQEEGTENAEPVYVGVHSYYDNEENQNLIHDWRAPVSSMFYDFELGEAFFEAPSGEKTGEIIRKRQYRIEDSKLEMMLDSSLYIRDDVLQKELGRSADDKMKNIVATIQRDQNSIIRNETSPTLIIQGVAGSGKTSIALHRIAFLLYRFKDTLQSRDIMIISPNKVFSDYISNVLPELGENSIPEMGMETVAKYILGDKIKFQTFFEQVNLLLENHDEEFIERIKFKSTFEFLSQLNAYVHWLKRERFAEKDIQVRYKTITAHYLRSRFNANTYHPLIKRHTAIASDVLKKVKNDFRYDLRPDEKAEIRKSIKEMMGSSNLKVIYKEFFEWIKKPDYYKTAKGSGLEYSDVFPLLYLKILLEGFETFKGVKHLIVDEMQDYSAVQYAVISRLFPCNKTILGDANQNVNPYSSTTTSDIQSVLADSEAVTLTKSYRSTLEITNFSLRVSPRVDIEAIERHGEEPKILKFDTEKEEFQFVLKKLIEFNKSDWNSFGIICKTQKQAKKLHSFLLKNGEEIQFLTPESSHIDSGALLTSAHLAKGLEFDSVLIPFSSEENYITEVDRSMLYVACTRAMHSLILSHTGKMSSFLE